MSDHTPGNPFQQLPPNQSDSFAFMQNDEAESFGLLENESFGDRYEVLQVRRGGMGEVYICRDINKKEDVLVALKTFQKRFFFEQRSREAFAREVSLWARLTGQPNVMPMMGLKQLNDRLFAVMLAVEPGPSGEITVRDVLKQGGLSWEWVLVFAFQIALGMSSAQKRVPGIVHGDLKPENLLLMQGKALFISDFGLARVPSMMGADVQLESTWAYRAVENWNASAGISLLSDIYSLGVILYELLTGQTPFRATTREEWRRAHQEAEPHPTRNFSYDVEEALMSLALRCLRKQPEARPQSFDAVLDEIIPLAQQYLPGLLDFLSPIARMANQAIEKDAKVMSIETLLHVGMNELALAELDAMPEEDFDGELWHIRGVALSENNRNEEALSAFEKALAFNLTEERRIAYLIDYGISLRRLEQYDEARDIFGRLLDRVPDQHVGGILFNLATVDIDSGHPERVIRYLKTFLAEHPAFPHGWANLGRAHEMLEHAEEAVLCFKRALALTPYMAQIQVWLARVYMDQFKLIHEAATTLDLALRQGYNSRECMVRFVACMLLLGQAEIVAQLYSHLKASLTKNEFSELETEIHHLVEKINRGKVQQHTPSLTLTSPEVGEKEFVSSQDRVRTSPPNGAMTEAAFTLPFHNIRMYLPSGEFSIDFYDDLTNSDYVDHFMDAWQQSTQMSTRTVLVSLGSSLKSHSTSFYFTICPGCRLTILTNRDPGKRLRCRGCETEHHTAPVVRDDLTKLLDAILKRLGWERVDSDPIEQTIVLVLFVQPKDPSQAGKAIEICRGAGFTQITQEHPLAVPILLEALRRGLLDRSQPFSIWQKTSTVLRTPDQPSSEIKQVVRLLETSVGSTNTMSAEYDASYTSLFNGSKRENFEERLRQKLQNTPNDIDTLVSLALTLSHNEKFKEAREKALIATGLQPNNVECWRTLGRVEMRCDRFREAVQALEKAREIDPIDTSTLHYLLHCYQQLGDVHRADEIEDLYHGLGNIPMKSPFEGLRFHLF